MNVKQLSSTFLCIEVRLIVWGLVQFNHKFVVDVGVAHCLKAIAWVNKHIIYIAFVE